MNRLFIKVLNQNIIEHILFFVLGIFAFFLFEERLVADSSYYIFKVINYERFWVEHNRYILIFSQWIPLIGVKIGLSLKTVLYLYSIGNVVYFYGIFLIARYYYKDDSAGILLLLIQTLGIMSGFFVPMFELYYCGGLLVLVSSILYSPHKNTNLIIFGILSFFILTGHPLSFILLLFILVLHIEKFKLKFRNYYLLALALIIGIFIYKKINIDEYEQGRINLFITNFKNAQYGIPYIKSLLKFLLEYYMELLFVVIFTLIILFKSKDFLKAALVGIAFAGSLILINLANYGFVHSRYQEQVYYLLSFIVAYPFVLYLINSNTYLFKAVTLFIALVIIVIRIYGISANSEFFVRRVEEIKSTIELARPMMGSKFIVKESNLKYDANWSYPIETMFFSSYESNKKTLTICTDRDINFNQNKSKLLPDQYLFRRGEIFNVETLNNKYFMLDNLNYSNLDN